MTDWRTQLAALGPAAYLAPDVARTRGFASLGPELLAVVADGQRADLPPGSVLVVPADERTGRASAMLLQAPGIVAALEARGIKNILFFKASHAATVSAQGHGLHVLAASAAIAQRFEHKLHLTALAEARGWPIPPTRVCQAGLPPVASLGWPPPWVVQSPRGHSGQTTARVDSEPEYDALRSQIGARPVRVAPLLAGPTLTLNAVVVGPGRVVTGEPYLQLTGLSACTPFPLGACGNVWEAGRFDREDVRALARRVGLELAAQGYRGAFGVDVLVVEGEALLIEVNPRLVSGLSLEAALYPSEVPPPAALHVAATAHPPIPLDSADDLALAPGVQASQLVFYSPADGYGLHRDLCSGRYEVNGDHVGWVGPELSLEACRPGDMVLWVRAATGPVERGAEIGRAQLPVSLADAHAPRPSAAAEALARSISVTLSQRSI